MILQYLAWFILIFTGMQFMVAVANLIFRPRLNRYAENEETFLSILIPARNEEKNISVLLNDLQKQSFQHIEIIVFDDDSYDNTASVVKKYLKHNAHVKLMQSKELPNGWLGKNFACHSLSKAATGDYFLFLDADVRIMGNLIGKVLAYARHQKLGLLSIFPTQVMNSIGERFTVPVMNYILLTLLPLFLVRWSRFISLSAANGQFMLFKASVYKRIEPHLMMKDRVVEDIAISRYLKKQKIHIACLSGYKDITCRMYPGFFEAIHGFSKNVIAFFGNSYLLAILFWLITSLGFLAVLLYMPVWMVGLYLTLYIATRVLVSLVSHQPVIENLFYIIPQQMAMGLFIFQSVFNTLKKEYQWKGRKLC